MALQQARLDSAEQIAGAQIGAKAEMEQQQQLQQMNPPPQALAQPQTAQAIPQDIPTQVTRQRQQFAAAQPEIQKPPEANII